MGVGVLYGKEKMAGEFASLSRWGGEMVDQVSFEKTTFNELPFKFEAGTPNVGAVLALETAIKYLNHHGIEELAAYENELLAYATKKFEQIEGLRILGPDRGKTSLISFF